VRQHDKIKDPSLMDQVLKISHRPKLPLL